MDGWVDGWMGGWMDGWIFGLFPLFGTLNNDTVYICVQIFVWVRIFHSLILKSGMAGSQDNSVFILLRNCQTVFQSG